MDWRELFKKYLNIVGEWEGVTFLHEFEWTPEEWKEIQKVLYEAENCSMKIVKNAYVCTEGCTATFTEHEEWLAHEANHLRAQRADLEREIADRQEDLLDNARLRRQRADLLAALELVADAGDDVADMAQDFISTRDVGSLTRYGKAIASIARAAIANRFHGHVREYDRARAAIAKAKGAVEGQAT